MPAHQAARDLQVLLPGFLARREYAPDARAVVLLVTIESSSVSAAVPFADPKMPIRKIPPPANFDWLPVTVVLRPSRVTLAPTAMTVRKDRKD